MTHNIPRLHVPHAPQSWDTQADPATWTWDDLPTLSPFILANGNGPAPQQTVARVCHDAHALYVRYDCADRDIWGTYKQR
ncbi:MAG: hypothetical protein HYR94_26930, partial [Chloroflexi bacterium]|nr:hypothetical protein [Chloroflexota bacterium]